MRDPRVAALVLHYRNWPGVADCLRGLEAQSRPADRVLLVDNCSGDGSLPEIRSAFPACEVLESSRNGGYSEGMNLGLHALASGDDPPDAVLLLTHDCLLAPDALALLTSRLIANERAGAVGPLLSLLDAPDLVYMAGGGVDPRTRAGSHARPAPTDPGLDLASGWAGLPPHAVQWLDGACILLRSSAWKGVGDFDSRYFLYYEDMDYGLRLNAAGWGLECVPGARAWHRHGDVNSAGVQYLGVRNRLLMLREHAPVRFVARDVARLMVQIGGDLAARDAARSVRGRRAAIALRDFALGRFGPPPQGLR